jgi:carbon-monoxide dehydrogenase medium subunit
MLDLSERSFSVSRSVVCTLLVVDETVSFKYFAPRSVDGALDLLAIHGEEGKILAGGQSLVPAMNFRLARPASLIDINRIDALDYVRKDGRELRIGRLPATRVSRNP